MKIMVAGAAGVVGRLLLPMLTEAGHEVTGLTRSASKLEQIKQSGAAAAIADVYDRDRLFELLKDYRPDVVIHQLTALSEWNLAENARIRIEGTRNLVDAALAAKVQRMIVQSISWAYEPGESVATEKDELDEGAPLPRKISVDGVIAMERAAAEMPHSVILRYGALYGPGTFYDHESGMFAGQVKLGNVPATDGRTSFLHIEDAARAALQALDWPAGPVNIVDDEPAEGKVWLPLYAKSLGAPGPVAQDGMNRGERGASNEKAKQQYGWMPKYPSWRDQLLRT
ncbi:NAD-dependent epimerase/dehydratase family protein [Paenibacillus sp. JDR-2]|uniref:NAD-dependent epimerase/dehydratase family protein n=1 Tax=Paenibacillus sp. (strain JDR-2) TaxID=324057 RepID=UPI000166A5A7|nr:NAD(P)-dependent oxidoreductase [Paenibacillus sp. JDR-2]ACT00617.1 NAD-dependent epimerase/dehydratase [Paenibacillus sp. JDR-2]